MLVIEIPCFSADFSKVAVENTLLRVKPQVNPQKISASKLGLLPQVDPKKLQNPQVELTTLLYNTHIPYNFTFIMTHMICLMEHNRY